jgi:hypothetical protein
MRGSRRISVILGEATSIDVTGKKVVMRDAELEYDYLIVATGATHSNFGHNNWAEAAPGLKTLGDATEISPAGASRLRSGGKGRRPGSSAPLVDLCDCWRTADRGRTCRRLGLTLNRSRLRMSSVGTSRCGWECAGLPV